MSSHRSKKRLYNVKINGKTIGYAYTETEQPKIKMVRNILKNTIEKASEKSKEIAEAKEQICQAKEVFP